MILAFAHPGLVVPDLEQAREFYEKMFGFRVLSDEGWHQSSGADRAVGLTGSSCQGYMMAGHNCFLELWQYQAPEQQGPEPASQLAHEQGIRHLAFLVDDCRAEYQRLLKLGGFALGEPVDVGNGHYAVYCRDPFGNIIELCEMVSADEHPTQLPGVNAVGNFSGK